MFCLLDWLQNEHEVGKILDGKISCASAKFCIALWLEILDHAKYPTCQVQDFAHPTFSDMKIRPLSKCEIVHNSLVAYF